MDASEFGRLAIDIGGTFTDVVELDSRTGALRFDKVPTTPSEPVRGVINAFGRAQTPIADVAWFTHGTTLGLNALLTRSGARTAVIGTRGFRDVYLLGRTDRRTNYDLTYRKPPGLLERYDTFEVTERCLADGSVRTPFDIDEARAVAATIAERGYEAVAVAFLHAYANPSHELAMRRVLAELAPDVEVTLSHELSREYREYERTSTAVLDAYIKPIVGRYLAALEAELSARDFGGRFLMTRSGGGAMTAAVSREQPVNLILSGPAGGVIGAAAFAELTGLPNLITIDMGGTSLDASLILDGEPVLFQGAEFEQLPINIPSLYIHTIGAGGGSLAWLDPAGALQVGPQSAGADPGPASYGAGGTEPTFTDAAVVLGWLGPETPLGGALTLDANLAHRALEPIAAQLGLPVAALAKGITQISITKIMGAVRAITVELGRDPKDFALLSFGGAGGVVAADVARELSIPTVVVPPGQGAFSALGMLMADVQHDHARTRVTPLRGLDVDEVLAAFAEMEAEGLEQLADDGFADPSKQQQTRSIDVRYAGQEHTVTIAFPDDTSEVVKDIEAAFAELHQRQYGHTMDDPVEITTLRVRSTGVVERPSLPELPQRSTGAPVPIGRRSVYRSEEEPRVRASASEPEGGDPRVRASASEPEGGDRRVAYDLYIREDLFAGDRIDGPAIIAEHTATTVVHPADRLVVGRWGELTITVAQGEVRA